MESNISTTTCMAAILSYTLDHKPLEMILRKPLHVAPPRLQRMLTKIQGYDLDILYQPGQSLVLADTLSRLPNEAKSGDVEVDHRVDSIVIDDISLDLMNFSPVKQTEIREETSRDHSSRQYTQAGQIRCRSYLNLYASTGAIETN